MRHKIFLSIFSLIIFFGKTFSQSELLMFKQLAIDMKSNQIVTDTSVFHILKQGRAVTQIDSPIHDDDVFLLIDQKSQSRRQIRLAGTSSTGYKTTYTDWVKLNKKELLKPVPATERAYTFLYGNETQNILGFDCKQLTLFDGVDSISVWYSETVAYNWLFDNIFALVPGTVIKAYNSKTTLLELISRKPVDEQSLDLEYSFIFKNWNTK